jgi:hypothetical protein
MVQAMELRPDYDDAMAYMNLLYRQKAEIDCSDPDAHDSDLRAADHWIDLVLSTRKAKMEKFGQEHPESGEGNSPPQHQ